MAGKLDDPIPDGPALIFEGLLPRGSEVVIAGETNVGKSLLSLELLSSFSTGEPLWGQIRPSHIATRILYVLGEHNNSVIQRLWQKTKLPIGCEVFLLGPEALGFDRWLVAKGQPNLIAIGKLQKWADKCDLIVWDPLSAFLSGEGGESDNVTMRCVLDTMNLISSSSGASCIVLAHQGKPTMDQFGAEHRRKTYAIRGASAIEDAATSVFYLNRAEPGDSAAQITNGALFELVQRKFKGDAPEKFQLLRNPDTLTHTLITRNPYEEALKFDANAKIGRIQAALGYDYKTSVKIVAASEGVTEATLQRRLGMKK